MTTRDLARAIERCEIHGTYACIRSALRLAPELDPQTIEVAGGVAAVAGDDSPLWQAVGLGMAGPVSADDVRRVTDFYRSRGWPSRVTVNPLADLSLSQRLAEAGYRPVEFQDALVADLAAGGRRDERIVETSDAKRWAETSAQGFMGEGPVPPAFALVGEIIASAEGVIALEARDELGTPAATGAMDVQGEIAGLFASSTLPAFRRRGWHTAFILDRLARARDAGARFARAAADVGGASEANFQRCGFRVLYTRTLWELCRSK